MYQRFRCLIDSIEFEKLVLFQDASPLSGVFEDGDHYGLNTTARVNNLNQFFNSKPIRKSMKIIKKLTIIGTSREVVDFEFNLNKLTYLDACFVTFSNPTIIENSSSIEILILVNVQMENGQLPCSIEKFNNEIFPYDSTIIYASGFGHLKSNIKHLSLIHIKLIDILFFEFCVHRGLLKEIEIIDRILIDSLETLEFIILNFSKLKKINCFIGSDIMEFFEIFISNQRKLNLIANKLKPRLKVYIFGILFKKQSILTIAHFFVEFGCFIHFFQGEVRLSLEQEFKSAIKIINQNEHLFAEFLKSIKDVKKIEFVDENFLKKLVGCVGLHFHFDKNSFISIFKKVLPILSNLSRLGLKNENFKIQYTNEILDLIPVYASNIDYLNLDNYCEINFDFLFKLIRLKYLSFYLRYPIQQSIYIELLRALKYLKKFDVYFVKPVEMEKDQLTSFKKLVLHCLKEEIKAKDFNFKIQIYKSFSSDQKVIRYSYKKDDSEFEIDFENAQKLCDMNKFLESN